MIPHHQSTHVTINKIWVWWWCFTNLSQWLGFLTGGRDRLASFALSWGLFFNSWKKPLKWSTRVALSDHAGPPITSKFRKYWWEKKNTRWHLMSFCITSFPKIYSGPLLFHCKTHFVDSLLNLAWFFNIHLEPFFFP